MEQHDEGLEVSPTSDETLSDIRELSIRCRELLNRLSTDDGPADGTEARDLTASFNIWLANMGVFREGQQSLTSRLKNAPQISELVQQLLMALKQKGIILGDSQEGSSSAGESEDSSDRSSTSSYRLLSPSDDDEGPPPRSTVWTSIQHTMTGLRQLALTIRLAGARHRQERIQRFKNLDRNEQVCQLIQTLARQMADFRFPEASEPLRERMAESIATRRARFLYLEQHQKKTSTLNEPAPALEQKEDIIQEIPSGQQQSPMVLPPQQGNLGPSLQPSVILSTTDVTKLDLKQPQPAQKSAKRAESVSSVKISMGTIPSIPTLDTGVETEEPSAQLDDTQSEAQRGTEGKRDLEGVADTYELECRNDSCDCKKSEKDSVIGWSTAPGHQALEMKEMERVTQVWKDISDKKAIPHIEDKTLLDFAAKFTQNPSPLSQTNPEDRNKQTQRDPRDTSHRDDKGRIEHREGGEFMGVGGFMSWFLPTEADETTRKRFITRLERACKRSALSSENLFLPEGMVSALVTTDIVRQLMPRASDGLVEFVCCHAKKVFLTTLLSRHDKVYAAMSSFYEHGITDVALPIKALMKGAHGEVHVALKQMKDLGEPGYNVQAAWASEAAALDQINQLHNKHLIRCTGAFMTSKNYYIMFEWADGGTLRDVWMSQNVDYTALNGHRIMQVLEQLHGLAEALSMLHNRANDKHRHRDPSGPLSRAEIILESPSLNVPKVKLQVDSEDSDNTGEEHWRHGDLKPDNILLFKDAISPWLGTLKIADLGLAKQHAFATPQRGDLTFDYGRQTRLMYSTSQYVAPEVVIRPYEPRSRLYDIWSMGCIIFEFLIWLLYGYPGLQNFYREHPPTPRDTLYFTVNPTKDSAQLSDIVKQWMAYMLRFDPECNGQSPSAIGDLIKLVRDHLLVVALPQGNMGMGGTRQGADFLERTLGYDAMMCWKCVLCYS
ncbi:hypothetical protein CDV31_013773 [Fusarium ambrosium]|uniref:Protein kinase domain-containing protein n=1 Tax=Fusarium ambrosium TaxID=131363 RepID=A0A428T0Y3_9HYPO|nr:hypothetical protein CDV31_013773 [Fusarium ambrosium]